MIDLITGHQGTPHISAEQVSTLNNVMMNGYGAGVIVRMKDGTVTGSGLNVAVSTGYWRADGFDMEIQEADSLILDPIITAGNSRIDIIYMEILQNIASGNQRVEYVIVQGEEGVSPTEPSEPTDPESTLDSLVHVTPICKCTVYDNDTMLFEDLTVPYTPSAASGEFIGTLSDWNDLSADEKAVYDGCKVNLIGETISIRIYNAGTDTFTNLAGDPTGAASDAATALSTANAASTAAGHAISNLSNGIEPTSTAAASHAKGDYIVYGTNQQFAEVTTAISAGDAIVDNGNVDNKTVAEVLSELNGALNNIIFGGSATKFKISVEPSTNILIIDVYYNDTDYFRLYCNNTNLGFQKWVNGVHTSLWFK